eukprot:g14179.t1
MPPSATSRPKLQGQSGVRWVALVHGARTLLLSLAVVVLGGGPSSPLVPSFSSASSSQVTPRFGFVEAASTTTDAAIKKQLQVENEEEDGLYSWPDERSSSDGMPLGLERNLAAVPDLISKKAIDDPALFEDSSVNDLVVLLEGCTLPAEATSVRVHNDKPTSGNIAENAIDGDPNTWWSRKGRNNRWMEVDFEGGEEDEFKVESVAIAFFRGHRRIAFFDMTLFDSDDNVVAKREDLESGGLTKDFETFYFDEPKQGSKIRIDVKGTTAGKWNGIAEISVCLQRTSTPSPVTPATVPPAEVSGVTYVGCFADDDTGLTRFLADASMQDPELTPTSCAAFCAGFKYMGLQYSQDCFCGDTYYTAERDAVPTDMCTMPCNGDESLICGGPWANSIYIVGDPAQMTAAELEALNQPRVEDGMPRRRFTINNHCAEQIRLGATGGFVKSLTDPTIETCPDGSVLDEAVGACFWGLPLPEDGATYDMEPDSSIEIVLDNLAVNDVRWSGTMWASTGCQRTVGCETATCLRNVGYQDGFCPPSTGPTGPVTKAEFTLVDTGVDYYDITTIDGVNLPVEMLPDPESEPLERDEDPYWCSNPGGVSSMSDALEGCSWDFDPSQVDGFEDQDMSSYLRWVKNDGLFTDCEVDSDCDDVEGEGVGTDLKCGALFGMDALNGGVTEEMFPRKCGSSLGWHSANKICGGSKGKPLGYFPNSFPFMCEEKTMQVIGDNSTQSDLYGCAGPYYGLSGYSKNSDDTACGCPDWVAEGINAPVNEGSSCASNNPFWTALSLPWLKFLKTACPTAYCFPYDDHSSTFVCRNEDKNNDHAGKNSMSYIINFCPAESQGNLLDW